jgi:outer membrane protein
LQQVNTIKQDNYKLLSDLEDVEDVKYTISLQVASSYLQILFDMELLDVAKNQLAITQAQVDRTKILVEAGSLAKGNLLEIQAQLANEELAKINAENNLKSSYLNLTQLLELDTTNEFSIQVPQLADPSEAIIIDSVRRIYEESLDLPMIKKQEYYLKSSEQTMKIAYGGLSPQVYLSASYGSGYSNALNKYSRIPSAPVEIGYVGSSGDAVYMPGTETISSPYSFTDQLKDNRSTSLVIGIQIPIFNRLATKNRISQSKLNVENSKYMLDLSKNQLFKDIQSARNSAEASLAKFKASQKAVEAQQESFSYTQQRFDLGLVNSVDYNTAKNLLTKTQSDMVQAKFEYIFRINILNYYQGIPFKL